MDKFKAAMKKFFSKNTLIIIRDFVIKYQRFFYAAILFAIIVVVLVNCTGPNSKNKKSDTESGTLGTEATSLADFEIETEYEQDKYDDVNQLISDYFTAYASDDATTLETIAYPITANEVSYIDMLSQYIEEFQNVSCYTMHGLNDGDYLVSAYGKIKFKDIETAAPTLEFFYVRTDSDGNVYIDNTYSSFNYSHMETPLDSDVEAVIQMFQAQEAVVNLRTQVQTEYSEALAADADLNTMITTTIPAAIREWAQGISTPSSESTETTEGTETTETTETTEDTEKADSEKADSEAKESEEKESEKEEETVTVEVIVTDVNIRSKASTDGKSLGKADKGDTFTKLGTSGDWTKIDYNGTTAYIKTEFLKEK